ncbi:MAG: RNA 2',3'-cyclic phosphodiesterase [Polyangiaceae bacterium]|jgi:2'-5' RNA ligase|nr:RNA 2',3'-cyclic phosphodiesterase [Polyangiaceae bacterium]
MLDTVRAFIAVNLEVAAIRKSAAMAKTLRSHPNATNSSIGWVTAPNLHLKLRDLGEMDRALAPALGDTLRELVTATAPFRLTLGSAVALPDAAQARLVAIDVQDPSGTVHDLALRVDQLALALGFPPSRRAFSPLLVLARLRKPTDVSAWLAAVAGSSVGDTRPTDCTLYDAALSRPNVEYQALQRLAFAAPPAARSQRPRSRAPSQRPKARSRVPEARAADAGSSIPLPPRLPNFAAPPEPRGNPAQEPALPAPLARSCSQGTRAARGPLPPAVEAALPPDDDWGD